MNKGERLTYLTGDIVRRAAQLELGVRRLEGMLAKRPWTGMADLPKERPFSSFANACVERASTWDDPVPGYVDQAIGLARKAYDERNRLTHDVWMFFEWDEPDQIHPDRTFTMQYRREPAVTSIGEFEACVEQISRADGAVLALQMFLNWHRRQDPAWPPMLSEEQTAIALRGGLRIGPFGRFMFDGDAE